MTGAPHTALCALLATSLFLAGGAARASDAQPYDRKAFEAAQQLGKPLLVEISADWCGNCKAQRPILEKILNEPRYADVARLRVDVDTSPDAARRFNVKFLSTLVLFRGKRELARSEGELDEARLRSMLSKAL